MKNRILFGICLLLVVLFIIHCAGSETRELSHPAKDGIKTDNEAVDTEKKPSEKNK